MRQFTDMLDLPAPPLSLRAVTIASITIITIMCIVINHTITIIVNTTFVAHIIIYWYCIASIALTSCNFHDNPCEV